ncbi:MAG: 16S rRNA (cytosine(1402)-N(4))-methyltransferase RsmH [Patescibacteria group bacterium]
MHISVLREKVLEYLNPQKNENFIDCTIGEGGHAFAILEKNGPKGKLLGIDWDPNQLRNLRLKIKNFKDRIILVHDNFAHLKEIVKATNFRPVHGILFDLGMSFNQIEQSGRGFSFQKDEPLDMRYSLDNPMSAEKIINYHSRTDLERVLKEYGQERFAREIAQEIVQERMKKPIKKTFQLVRLIENATPRWYQRQRIHPATKTFQALRIAVNDELENLKLVLSQAASLLTQGGRMAVVSFHSLEDRIVKNFLRLEPSLQILTRKPIVASFEERKKNPRSRSAKLRAAKKIL